MNPTMPRLTLVRKTDTPQVIEDRPRAPRILTQVALQIFYEWMFRLVTERALAKKYELTRPQVEEVLREVLGGKHGPVSVPAVRATMDRMVA